jgi:hypothetical protein
LSVSAVCVYGGVALDWGTCDPSGYHGSLDDPKVVIIPHPLLPLQPRTSTSAGVYTHELRFSDDAAHLSTC